MFVLCIAYVCVSVCLDPLMHLDQLQWHNFLITKIAPFIIVFTPEYASAFRRHASEGASVVVRVYCRENQL